MEEIAEVYSRSLFEVASEHGDLDRVHEELGQFADAVDENRELQVFFFSPYFSSLAGEGATNGGGESGETADRQGGGS